MLFYDMMLEERSMKRSVLLTRLAMLGAFLIGTATYAQGVKLAKSQVLRFSNGSEPRELDPAKATGEIESNIIMNIFEGLTSLDPVSLRPIPATAESWQVSPDGKTYTFKLRKNIKWSDGKPVTAGDFVYAWQRALDPKTAAEYAYILYYIKNGEPFNQGKLKDAKKLGIAAKDPQTLVVTLENPTPYFPSLTAFYTYMPVPEHVVQKAKNSSEWASEKTLVGNGPFKLTEWKLNKHIKVVKNDHYWDAAGVTLQEAFFYPIENQVTEERMFMAGELDLTNNVLNAKIPLYKKQIKSNPNAFHPFKSGPMLGSGYFRFNVTAAPLNDKRVRKALALTVDRTMIAEKVLGAGEIPAQAFTPPGTAGYTAKPVLNTTVKPQDIAAAKKLLAEAGYPDGKGLPKIELLYNTSENHKKLVTAMQQMWKKNLGVEIGLVNEEWKVYLNSTQKMNYQIGRAGWTGDYNDPNTFLDMFVTDGGNNNTGWSSKEYDNLIKQATLTQDQNKRFEIFQKAESILLEDLPILPLYVYVNKNLASEKLKLKLNDGKIVPWQNNIQDFLLLKYIVLAE
jgi:oligopeptide transport system substrate-binding protein